MPKYQKTGLLFTNKISKYTDDELLVLFRKTQNDDYFTELYSRYIALTYGLCLNYSDTKMEAEDAVMELFIHVREKVLIYEVKNFKTWLYSVAKHHCLRNIQNNKYISVELNGEFMESEDFSALFNEKDKEEKFNALQRCLEKLPAPQQTSIELFFIHDKSYAQIAESTGFHLKSIKSYIQNGKRNLKICMENEE